MSFYAFYPPEASGTSTNASIGPTGTTAPSSATEVAGVNPSGNLQPLQTDSAGNLLVDIASPIVSSGNITEFASSPVQTGTGASGAGIPRVTVSNDSSVLVSSLPSIPAGSNAIGSVSVSNFPGTQPVSGTVAVSSIASALPSGTNTIGAISNTSFAATQATASALNATVVGSGTAGSPASGVITIQGITNGTAIPVSGTVTASNPSVGTDGAAAPTSSTQIGGSDGTNLQPLQVDASKNLKVNLQTSLPAGTNAIGSITNTSFIATQATASNLNATVVQTTPANLQTTVTPASGSTFTVVQPTGTNLHAVLDSGSTTAVTQPTASNLNATVVGSGTAGTPSAGVVTIQGITGGTAIPVSGTITASNPSVGTDGSAAPTSSTQIGGSDGTNLQPLQVDASKNLKVNLQTALPAGTNAIGSITNTSFAVTQATASNLNATIAPLTSSSTVTVVQPTGTNLHAVLDSGSTTAVTQATAANLNATVVGTGTFATQVTSLPSTPAGTNSIGKVSINGSPGPANAPVYNVYSTTNITTSAYTQLIASTTSATNYVDIFDSSGQGMILAVGAAGSEVIQAYISPGGDEFALQIPAGSRVAYKALTANATTGYLLLNLFQ
jgi:hypothetical protein